MNGYKLSLLLCYCHIIGICLLVHPSSVSAYTEKELKSLKVFLGAVFNEATGNSDAEGLWDCSCGNRTYSDFERRVYHRIAGILLWLWLDLPTTFKMTSLFNNAIESIREEKGVNIEDYIDIDSFVTILKKVKNDLSDHVILEVEMQFVENHINSEMDSSEENYLKSNMLYNWKYWEQNPATDFALHFDFIILAIKEIDKCYNILGRQQTWAQIILLLASHSNKEIADKMNKFYQKKLFFARFTLNRITPGKKVGEQVNCAKTDKIIDPLLYHLVSEVITIRVVEETVGDIFDELKKQIIENPDYGRPKMY